MKRALILILATASCTYAQEKEKGNVIYQTSGVAGAVFAGGFDRAPSPVVGAPYSATVTNESIQTLGDGNRLIQKTSGTTARDSQGRTRQDAILPAIGNMAAANAPKLVFIHDPVTQTSYTLNLAEKTAQKMPTPPPPGETGAPHMTGATFTMRVVDGGGPGAPPLPPPDADAMPAPPAGSAGGPVVFEKHVVTMEQNPAATEDLGSQTMEGVLVNGVRTTRTIPEGQIGNERPITIVTEIWTSPELKTIVYSRRSDPRIGEQTFRLTNIVRTEPNASLFAVPADFKVVDGPTTVFFKTRQ